MMAFNRSIYIEIEYVVDSTATKKGTKVQAGLQCWKKSLKIKWNEKDVKITASDSVVTQSLINYSIFIWSKIY